MLTYKEINERGETTLTVEFENTDQFLAYLKNREVNHDTDSKGS